MEQIVNLEKYGQMKQSNTVYPNNLDALINISNLVS